MMTTQQKIRNVRRYLKHWMSLRQPNPIMGRTRLQETAETESLRLAGVLDKLERIHREEMSRIAEWAKHQPQTN